jgi:SAM-dependent methyltransferase
MDDPRQRSPAAARNREPILRVLAGVLPAGARVLEIASGSGEHAVSFAAQLDGVWWQPSDPSPEARASIDGWRASEGLASVAPAVALDVLRRPWPVGSFDAVVCINMIHIAPWAACEALLAEGPAHLAPGGLLFLYGPFKRGGVHTAPSNQAFDLSLRARDPSWGVRDLGEVAALAAGHGLRLEEVFEMPGNNLSVAFRRGRVPDAD